MSAESPELRCADSDRDRIAGQLREHYAEGRLDLDEFQERANAVYAAKTFGDLEPLTVDLPARPVQEHPQEAKDEDEECASGRGRLMAMWSPWLTTSVICIGIWLISMLASSQFIYPWPVWVAGPWGVILLVATLGGTGSQRRHLERREQRQRARQLRREWHDQALESRHLRISQDQEHKEHRDYRDRHQH
ncbi:MAG: DUF1707 SHOCT-like domain-containing protein [Streptosporangiales bacterium]